MVDYSTWVSIVRLVAGDKGADLTDFGANSKLVSVAAEIWNDRKAELKAATSDEAEDIARSEVTVR